MSQTFGSSGSSGGTSSIMSGPPASYPPGPTYAPGRWYMSWYGANSPFLQTANQLRFSPLWVTQAHVFTGLGLGVTTAGTTGSVIRLGVYTDNGAGGPSNLILDAGTVDGTATGFQSLTGLTIPLATGPYWLASAFQGSPTTQPTVQCVGASTSGPGYVGNPTLWSQGMEPYMTSVTGALPLSVAAGQPSYGIETPVVGLLA